VGYNSDEGQTFSRASTPEDYIASVKERYGPFADRLIKAYPPGEGKVSKTARDLARDATFGWHTWIWLGCNRRKERARLTFTASISIRTIRPIRRAPCTGRRTGRMWPTCSSI